jgi:hypothetical protein
VRTAATCKTWYLEGCDKKGKVPVGAEAGYAYDAVVMRTGTDWNTRRCELTDLDDCSQTWYWLLCCCAFNQLAEAANTDSTAQTRV